MGFNGYTQTQSACCWLHGVCANPYGIRPVRCIQNQFETILLCVSGELQPSWLPSGRRQTQQSSKFKSFLDVVTVSRQILRSLTICHLVCCIHKHMHRSPMTNRSTEVRTNGHNAINSECCYTMNYLLFGLAQFCRTWTRVDQFI